MCLDDCYHKRRFCLLKLCYYTLADILLWKHVKIVLFVRFRNYAIRDLQKNGTEIKFA